MNDAALTPAQLSAPPLQLPKGIRAMDVWSTVHRTTLDVGMDAYEEVLKVLGFYGNAVTEASLQDARDAVLRLQFHQRRAIAEKAAHSFLHDVGPLASDEVDCIQYFYVKAFLHFLSVYLQSPIGST